MNEFLIYLSISLFCLFLFFVWYRRQGQVAERKWLLDQINQTSGQEQQSYVNALQQLKGNKASLMVTIWMGVLILPATFAIDYLWFHEVPLDQRVSAADAQMTDNPAMDMQTAIKQLQEKLVENPDDLEGQLLYGRSMMSTQQYEYAVGAYQKANQLMPNNATILTDLAEAIAFKNNTGSFLGEPEQYLEQAIAVDPQHQKAMWLQGIVYYENLQYLEAEKIWTDLLFQVSSPNIKSTITEQINQARKAQNKATIDTDPSVNPIQASTAGYFVVINASESMRSMDFKPSARIFVYAKQVNGPPMPIAAAPVSQPFNWPISIQLSDANSLNPERKLSDFEQIEFSAKLSHSGSATPAADDIQSERKVADKQTKNITLTFQ